MPPAPAAPGLAPQRAALGLLVSAGALGLGAQVAVAAARARASGVSEAVLREALRMLVPYAGYPRALAALSAARLAPPGSRGGSDEVPPEARESAGRRAFEQVYGPSAERVLASLAALDPLLPAWTVEHAYGRVLARPGLPLRERELLAVSLLTALGGLEDPLLGHMRGALRLGASEVEIGQAIEAVPAEVAPEPRASARALLGRLGPL